MTRSSFWLASLLLLLLLIACSGEERHASPDGTSSWSIDTVPSLDLIGTDPSGDLVFGSAAGATRLSDGTIVIADGLEKRLRFFDETGSQSTVVGREGEGPGEFSHIEWLGRCGGDTLFVWDSDLSRLTVVDALGNVARSYRLPDDPTAAAPTMVNCSRQGVFAFLGTPANMGRLQENGEWIHFRAPLSLADARGQVTRRLGEVAAFEGRPLGKTTSIALSSDYLYVGTKDSAFVDVYALDGRRVRALPVGVAQRATSLRHYEQAIDVQVSRLASANDRRVLKELMLGWPMPEHLPLYGNLLTDPAGTLWVQISMPGDPETWLRVIGIGRENYADLRLPRHLRVLEIGLDYLLGSYEDEGGEPHVVMYRMRRSAESGR